MNVEHTHIIDALKLTPPAVVTVTSATGIVHWDTISYILAAVYTSLMIMNFFWTKLIKPHINRKVAAVIEDGS